MTSRSNRPGFLAVVLCSAALMLGAGVVHADGNGETPASTWLAPPWPNPCSHGARLAFSLARPGGARLELLDAAGRRVRTVVQGALPAGRQANSWDGRTDAGAPVPAGAYFLRLTAPGVRLTKRVMVVQ